MLTGSVSSEDLEIRRFLECVDRRDMGTHPWKEVTTEDPREIVKLGLPATACGFRVYTRVLGTVRVLGKVVDVASYDVETGPQYRICDAVSISYMEALLPRAGAGEAVLIRDIIRRAAAPGARILKTGLRYDVVTDPSVVVIDAEGNRVTTVLTEPPQP